MLRRPLDDVWTTRDGGAGVTWSEANQSDVWIHCLRQIVLFIKEFFEMFGDYLYILGALHLLLLLLLLPGPILSLSNPLSTSIKPFRLPATLIQPNWIKSKYLTLDSIPELILNREPAIYFQRGDETTMAYTINLDPVLTLASAASFETLLDLGIQLHSIKLYLDRSRLYSSIYFRFFFFFFK